jgi:tRNA-Thr(GGU) m(6)t(6)A37 methyltransferase TsaA
MLEKKEPRQGELAIALPQACDAGVYFIGRIRTPFTSLADCPKNVGQSTVLGRIELDPRYAPALKDVPLFSHLLVLYWMHHARRDLLLQVPSHLGLARGTFALRSPVRPNPIAVAAVELVKAEVEALTVRGIDCLDGTPVLDIKPYFASIDSIPTAKRP